MLYTKPCLLFLAIILSAQSLLIPEIEPIRDCDFPVDCSPATSFASCDDSACPGAVRCVLDSCDNCSVHFQDAAGKEMCQDNTCPTEICAIECPFGYQVNATTGCATCVCRDKPQCGSCGEKTCRDPEEAVVRPFECCPICRPSCAVTSCLERHCGPGFKLVTPPGECCPECIPVQTNFLCNNISLSCPAGFKKAIDFRTSCEYCTPVVSCNSIECPNLLCNRGNITFTEELCCASCERSEDDEDDDDEKSTCEGVHCQFNGSTECPIGTSYVPPPGGECCGYCTLTQSYQCNPTMTTSCNANDEAVCRPGYYEGGNCTIAIPQHERAEVILQLRACKCPLQGDQDPTSSTLKALHLIVAHVAETSVEHVRIDTFTTDNDGCCLFNATVADKYLYGHIDETVVVRNVKESLREPTSRYMLMEFVSYRFTNGVQSLFNGAWPIMLLSIIWILLY